MVTYGIGDPSCNVWANWDFILKQSLVGDIGSELRDVTIQIMNWSTNSTTPSNPKCWINNFIIYSCVNRNSTQHKHIHLTRTITYTDHQPRYPAPSKPASEMLRRQGSVSQQPCTAASRRPSSPPRYWHQRSGTIAATARAAMPVAAAAAPAYQTKRNKKKRG